MLIHRKFTAGLKRPFLVVELFARFYCLITVQLPTLGVKSASLDSPQDPFGMEGVCVCSANTINTSKKVESTLWALSA